MPETIPEYRFDRYRLLPGERRLLEDERPVKLGGRAFDALLTLIEARDRAVSKEELMERVWPRLVVEENNLQVQVAALRKVLGPAAIATIPGRGYRFTMPVQEASASTTSPATAPSTRSAPRPPLFGRDDDVATIRRLFEQHAIVSIVGAGGIGKTRVAHAVADAMHDVFADGVRCVDLAPVTDARLVASEVARALDIHVGSTIDDPVDVVASAVASRQQLLLMDNCEHLTEAVAMFLEVLSRHASGMRILVTSQEPLKTSLEHVYRLGSLAVPVETLDANWQSYGAVQLFVDRARASDSRFAATVATAASIVEICRRLDGIPLALELAAARVPLLGVEGLRARLDERFHVLTGGSRFALRRHQTLRAALDFSHALLTDDERMVFRRLAVFAGSFAVDSAQDTCADERMDRWRLLDCLGGLVDKSMVVAQGGASPRLRLLETTRAYALEKLADAGETLVLLERHARSVAQRFRAAYDDFWCLSPSEWLARYEPELDNLRVAVDWALRHDPALAIELVGDSLKLWHELALQPEGLRYCAAAAAHIDDATPPRAAGRLWYAQALLIANSHPRRSRESVLRAIPLLREAHDTDILALSLTRFVGVRLEPKQEHWDALAELERLERPDWGRQLRWLVPNARATLQRGARNLTEARRNYAACCDIAEALGDHDAALKGRTNVADLSVMLGEFDEAIAMLHRLVAELATRPDQLFYCFALAGLATALVLKGDVEAARAPFAAAMPLMVRYDISHRYADALALLAVHDGRVAAAARLLGYSEAQNTARDETRDALQTTARERALELLAGVDRPNLDRWMGEGAQARDADLCAQAIGTAT